MINSDLNKLISSTTIVKVENNTQNCSAIDDYYISRFQRDQGSQVDLASLENHWNGKWASFGNNWSKDRQTFRFLYDTFRLFYYSFEQLRCRKISSIGIFEDKNKILYFNDLCGVNLYGVYSHGKKCIDLLKELGLLISGDCNWDFCQKFSESRNKLIEHNYNPNGLNLRTDPSIWSLSSTDSLMEIHVHTAQEREFDVYIDYYEDYYRLEKIITDIIKTF